MGMNLNFHLGIVLQHQGKILLYLWKNLDFSKLKKNENIMMEISQRKKKDLVRGLLGNKNKNILIN